MVKPTKSDLRNPEALPRGILTQGDRQFLKKKSQNEEDINEQTERDTRYRIRERTRIALSDFTYLGYEVSQEDIDQIFSRLSANNVLSQICISTFTFFYRGLSSLDIRLLEEYLEAAIRNHEWRTNDEEIVSVDVDISIRREKTNVDEALTRIVEGEGRWSDFLFLAYQEEGLDKLYQRLEEEGESFEVTSEQHPDTTREITREFLQELRGVSHEEDDESEQ